MKQLFFITIFFFSILSSQDNYLIKIGEEVIFPAEFLNIYNKNRTDSDTIIKASEIDEYLNLFINFKLKVIEAESLGMDTLESFKKELAGYRNQLSKSYLTDSKVTEKLLKEAYERLKFEINASHILIAIESTASPEDTLKAFQKIKNIRNEYYSGSNFEDLAVQYSDDPSAINNKGNLGYFSALRMVYSFETVAYNTNVGDVSEPIRTNYGYHILKVNDKRKSRGDVKVAHIMIANDKKNNSDSIAKVKIFEIYDLLNTGSDFADLAKKYSDDKKSGSNGGELDWFGVTNKVNMYETFANASFEISEIGGVSQPIKTPVGWHIIKLLDKKELPSFSDMESSLKSRVEKDSRSQKSRDSLINRCKEFYLFKEYKKYLNIFYKLKSQDILESKNTSDLLKKSNKTLFSLTFNEKQIFTQKDFADFIMNFRNSFRQQENSKLIIDELYRMFVEQSIVNFENKNLEDKYEEFSLLMDEYHDGILLFDLMNEKVWSKAVKDTLGLNEFYKSLLKKDKSKKYFFLERYIIKSYETYSAKNFKKLLKYIQRGFSDDQLISKFNKTSNLNLKIGERIHELEDEEIIISDPTIYEDLGLRPENISGVFQNYWRTQAGVFYAEVIVDTLEESSKPIDSVKGLVISEYQDFLEKEWLNILKEKYQIVINKDILNLLKENKLDQVNNLVLKEVNDAPVFKGSFSEAFRSAVLQLGSSKETYFKWRDNIYTTEIK